MVDANLGGIDQKPATDPRYDIAPGRKGPKNKIENTGPLLTVHVYTYLAEAAAWTAVANMLLNLDAG